VFYNPKGMSKPITFEAVRAAFDRGEFDLVYQPIVSLNGAACLGAEALIRWHRPDGSVITAGEFITVTDRTPLSGMISYWVIDRVADQLMTWLEVNPQALIAINIPPEVLGRGGLEYAARKSGRRHASQILLEITERGVPDQLGLDALNLVPSTGAAIALDDVTFSGANLALLMRFPFNYLKIDQSLTRELIDPERKPQWLNALSALLSEAPIQVIAEGIESETQIDVLRSANIPWGQGHYLSRPLTADELQSFYADRATERKH
jgi:EAL domain-containing protein (putative c-di-GMP-specific phosphodiesterase class I)